MYILAENAFLSGLDWAGLILGLAQFPVSKTILATPSMLLELLVVLILYAKFSYY